MPKAEAILAFARTAKLLDLHGKLSTVRNQKVANQTKERTDLLVSLAENAATLIKDGSAADYRIDNLRRDEKGKTIS
ncbi:MAG: hypothetical protein Q8O99_03420 [bacterium]|nr:hypothetical protein [bacterium]